MNKKNWPNVITVLRIVLALVIIFWMLIDRKVDMVKFGLFLLVALSDFLDGMLARKFQASTQFGKFLDPMADKIATLGIFLCFYLFGDLHWWFFYAFACREVVQGFLRTRAYIRRSGALMPTPWVNKIKTALCYVLALLLFSFELSGKETIETSKNVWVFGLEIFILILAFFHWVRIMFSEKGSLKAWLFGLFVFFILPNILFWIIGEQLYLIRGVVVAEYFLLACLFRWLPRKLFVTLWIILALFDLLVASTSLYFMDFSQMAEAAMGIEHLAFLQVIKWIFYVIVFIVLTWLLLRVVIRLHSRYGLMKPSFLLTQLLVLMVLDFLNGNNTLNNEEKENVFHVHTNVVSAPTFAVSMGLLNDLRGHTNLSLVHARSVSREIFQRDDTTEKQMLVLVESWGLLLDTTLQNSITKSLEIAAKGNGYYIKKGRTNFKFLTQVSAMREITGYYVPFAAVDSSAVRDSSLFLYKQKKGYEVIGLHGYSSGFYGRRHWWPRLGIQKGYFAEQFKEMNLPTAGNTFFHGAADVAIADWLFNKIEMDSGKKQFYYWMTLNSHLPLEKINSPAYSEFKNKWKNSNCDEEVQRLTYTIKELFDKLAKEISSRKIKMHLLLVGDHAPPFTDPHKRNCYDKDFVPFIELTPEKL